MLKKSKIAFLSLNYVATKVGRCGEKLKSTFISNLYSRYEVEDRHEIENNFYHHLYLDGCELSFYHGNLLLEDSIYTQVWQEAEVKVKNKNNCNCKFHFLLQVAFTLFQLGLWTPPVSAYSSSCRPVVQAEDGRELPQSWVCLISLVYKEQIILRC